MSHGELMDATYYCGFRAGYRAAAEMAARGLDGMADKSECKISAKAYRNGASEQRRCVEAMILTSMREAGHEDDET